MTFEQRLAGPQALLDPSDGGWSDLGGVEVKLVAELGDPLVRNTPVFQGRAQRCASRYAALIPCRTWSPRLPPTDPLRPYRTLRAIADTLQGLVERDPDQEVLGVVVPVLHQALKEGKEALEGNSIAKVVDEYLISPENCESGEPLRAADALVIVRALMAQLPNSTISVPQGRIQR